MSNGINNNAAFIKGIQKDFVKEVLDALLDNLDKYGDVEIKEFSSEFTQLRSRLSRLEKNIRNKLVNYEDAEIELNSIRYSILQILDEVDIPINYALELSEEPFVTLQTISKKSKNSSPLDNILKILILLLCSVFGLVLISILIFPSNEFKEDLPRLTSSLVCCGGALFGYMRWRVIEIKYLN